MYIDKSFERDNLSQKQQEITSAIGDAVEFCQGDTIALLSLLRQLEMLHREICDGVFQDSLPDNRQALYALLREIESEGGWPYVERMKLRDLLVNLQPESLD